MYRSDFSLFPNIGTDGEYDFISQTIKINKISSADEFRVSSRVEDIKLLVHEITHYRDNVSSLRGIDLLVLNYNAIHSRESNDTELFFNIKKLYKEILRMKFSKYFTVINQSRNDDVSNRWNYKITTGYRFDNDGRLDKKSPIMFINFYTNANEFIARVPLSFESIVESRAMYNEFMIDMAHISSLNDEEQIVERGLLQRYYEKLIYNTDVIVYYVNARFVANVLGFSDILQAFQFSSLIGFLCLNMPIECYKKLRIPSILQNEAKPYFIKNSDISFLFACITYNIQNFQNIHDQIINDNLIETILEKSNLPKISELKKLIVKEVNDRAKTQIDGKYKDRCDNHIEEYIKHIKNMNFSKDFSYFNNFRETYEMFMEKSDVASLDVAPIIFGNDEDTKACEFYKSILSIERRMKEFSDACGI
ncbi:MAG: hypothetical protein FWD82_04445 [Defluviitaleaceae bacterium]|nr:hypothetical protein [Defluviitaleaceae bacterium]